MEANRIEEKIYKYGADILASEGMQKEKTFVQHGSITCYDHSLRVAEKSLELAEKCSAYIDERSLVRGALLHEEDAGTGSGTGDVPRLRCTGGRNCLGVRAWRAHARFYLYGH